MSICIVLLQLQCSGWWVGWFVMEGSSCVTSTNSAAQYYASHDAVSYSLCPVHTSLEIVFCFSLRSIMLMWTSEIQLTVADQWTHCLITPYWLMENINSVYAKILMCNRVLTRLVHTWQNVHTWLNYKDVRWWYSGKDTELLDVSGMSCFPVNFTQILPMHLHTVVATGIA